jgi:hypothetical protein
MDHCEVHVARQGESDKCMHVFKTSRKETAMRSRSIEKYNIKTDQLQRFGLDWSHAEYDTILSIYFDGCEHFLKEEEISL